MKIRNFNRFNETVLLKTLKLHYFFKKLLFLYLKKENDSILTINEKFISLLVKKSRNDPSYGPTKVMKILHRNIPQKNLNNTNYKYLKDHGINSRRGVLLDCKNTEKTVNMQIDMIASKTNGNKTTTIKSIVFPGTLYSNEILNNLDQKYFEFLNQITQKNIYLVAAFCVIIATSTHGFFDANGRTAIGMAKFLIDKYSNKKLSLIKLYGKKLLLGNILTLSTLELLPEKENIGFVNKNQEDGDVVIDMNNYSDKDIDDFKYRFKESIIKTINEFSNGLNLSNESLMENVLKLADYFESCSD